MLQDRKGNKINQKVKTRKQIKECGQLEKGKILSQQWEKPRKNFTVCAAESSDLRIGSSRVSGTGGEGVVGVKELKTRSPAVLATALRGFPLPGGGLEVYSWEGPGVRLPGLVEDVPTGL